MDKIIKNNSKGYGYNYASLSDIASQGFEIPKMTTGTDPGTGRDYVYYLDGENWLRGAAIIVPEGKGMNKAQLYGSALTYARRYTTLMALGLCCDDDVVIENLTSDGNQKDKAKEFEKYYTQEEINTILGNHKIKSINDLDDETYNKYINFKKYGKKHNSVQ